MTARDTQPTQPIPDQWVVAAESPRRRRRAWPWLVAFAIVVGLAVVAWFAGEAIAKDIVTKTIREQVVTQLSLPAVQLLFVVVLSGLAGVLAAAYPARRAAHFDVLDAISTE